MKFFLKIEKENTYALQFGSLEVNKGHYSKTLFFHQYSKKAY